MDQKEDEVINKLKTKTIVDTKKGFVGVIYWRMGNVDPNVMECEIDDRNENSRVF